eukprot:2267158-Ditylum_brightwellii.AAC.1
MNLVIQTAALGRQQAQHLAIKWKPSFNDLSSLWQAGTAMTTAKTTTQAEITIMITEAAAISIKLVTLIDLTIIVTREAEEATVVMTGKKEIGIVLETKASQTMWRKSAVALAPDLRVAAAVAVALQAAATF